MGNVVPLPQLAKVVWLWAVSDGWEVRVAVWPPTMEAPGTFFADARDALRHAERLATSLRCSVLFTPVPKDAP